MRAAERLDGLNPSEILLFFINNQRPILRSLEIAELVEMISVLRAYILGGYNEQGLEMSARVAAVWARILPRLRRYTVKDGGSEDER